MADEHELIDHALDTLLIDEGEREQQEVEPEKDEGNSEDEDEGPQQEMNVVAPVVTAERVGGSPRPANRRPSLPNLEQSPEPNHNEAGSRSDYEYLKRTPLILLLASPIAGAVVVEGSGVQGEKHWGDQIQG